MNTRAAKFAFFAFCGAALISAFAGFFIVSLPFGILRQQFGRFSHGNADHLTANLWTGIRFCAGYLIVLSSLTLLLVLRFRRRIKGKLAEYLPIHDFLADIKTAFTLPLSEWLSLAALILLAFLLRLSQMQRMLHGDEIWTAFTFSRNPLAAITEYWTTNNHIFHSFLLALILPVVGDSPWAIRSVAFVTGILIVPAIYLWVRCLTSQRQAATAFLATFVVACNPLLCQYSACARGYSLQALLAILAWVLADRFCHGRNDYLLVLSAICALALWTMPTSVMIVAGVFVVVVYHLLLRDVRVTEGVWLAASTAGFTGLLWLPALLFRGGLICYNEPPISPWLLMPRVLLQGAKAITNVRELANVPVGLHESLSERFSPFFHAVTLLTPTDYLLGAVGSGYIRFQYALAGKSSPILVAVAVLVAIGVATGPSRWRAIAIGSFGCFLLVICSQGVGIPLRGWVFILPLVAVAFSFGTLTVAQWLRVRNPLIFASLASIAYLSLCLPSIAQNHPTHAGAERIAAVIATRYDSIDAVDIINFSPSRGQYLWSLDYYVVKALARAGLPYEVKRQCQCQYYPWQGKPKESKIHLVEVNAETVPASNVIYVTYLSDDVRSYWDLRPSGGKWDAMAERWALGRQITITPFSGQ